MSCALDGIKVLDLTQVLFGPFCTMLLSDMGAEVVKVERPGIGDIARGNGPVVRNVSTYFLSLNRGKKSVTLDLSRPEGTTLFLRLCETADVVISNFVPGTMEKLGLGYEPVRKVNPRIIYALGSGFGQNGPYRDKPAFDVIVQAMGGIMSITGEENGPPIRPGVSYGDIAAGLFLCVAILAALQERSKSGQGQLVDISMLDSQITVQENAFARYLNAGDIPVALGTRHPVYTPFQVFRTRDGFLALALRGGYKDQWPLFCAAIERVDLIDDPRFKDGWERTQHYKELEPILNEVMKTRTTREWITEFERLEIPCGPVNTIPETVHDPQVAARNMIIDVDHPANGRFKVVSTPFRFSRTPCQPTRASPELGEHTAGVLSEWLNMSDDQINKLKEKGIT